jgi:hypothetical protein
MHTGKIRVVHETLAGELESSADLQSGLVHQLVALFASGETAGLRGNVPEAEEEEEEREVRPVSCYWLLLSSFSSSLCFSLFSLHSASHFTLFFCLFSLFSLSSLVSLFSLSLYPALCIPDVERLGVDKQLPLLGVLLQLVGKVTRVVKRVVDTLLVALREREKKAK